MDDFAADRLQPALAQALDHIRANPLNGTPQPLLTELLCFRIQRWRMMQQSRWFDSENAWEQQIMLVRAVLTVYGQDDPLHARAISAYYLDGLSIAKTLDALNFQDSHATLRRLVVEQGALALAHTLTRMERQLRQQWVSETLHQLPSLPQPSLHGRAADFQILYDRLAARDQSWLVALAGLGGCGKTVLAQAVVRQLVHDTRFLQVVWLHLNDLFADQTAASVEVLFAALLRRIGDKLTLQKTTLAELELYLQRVMRQESLLIVIDGLDDPAQWLPLYSRLFALVQPSKLLLIGRVHPPREPQLYVHPLQPLAQADAIGLLQALAQNSGVIELATANEATLLRFFARVGGHPQAIQLVVKLVAYYGSDTVLTQLHAADIDDIDALYQHIYAQLWQLQTPDSRALLRSFLLVAAGGASVDYLTALHDTALWRSLAQLLDLALVVRSATRSGSERLPNSSTLPLDRYTIHALTRSYLLVQQQDQSLHELILRACDYWQTTLQSPEAFDVAYANVTQLLSMGLPRAETWQRCATLMEKLYLHAYNSQQWVGWITTLALACDHAPVGHPLRSQLLAQLGNLYRLAGFLEEAIRVHHAALAQAEAQTDVAGIGRAAYYLAIDYRQARDYTQALTYAQMTHDVVIELRRPATFQAVALNTLGMISHFQADFAQADDLFAQSWQLATEAPASTRALICNNWGNTLWRMGKMVAAEGMLQQAWTLAQASGARETLDTVLSSYFAFAVRSADGTTADTLLPFVQPRVQSEATAFRDRLSLWLALAEYFIQQHGDVTQALTALQEVQKRLAATPHPRAAVELYALLARIAMQQNEDGQAEQHWQQARVAADDAFTRHLLRYHLDYSGQTGSPSPLSNSTGTHSGQTGSPSPLA